MLIQKNSLDKILKEIPSFPGVYKMINSEGKVIYVGKAKNLKNRVKSYFQKRKDKTIRTEKMVSQISDIQWIEVGSDLEAILLETNLIKEFMPKYNVLMKDDKNFVYLKITNEDFPRIEIVRKVLNDGAKYFGPKTAANKLERTLNILQKIFNFRQCGLDIKWIKIGEVAVSNKVIAYPCLDFHIKRCEAPCISKITPSDYRRNIDQIVNFFNGRTSDIETSLNAKMLQYVENKNFEMAAKIRDKLLTIIQLTEKQIISSPDHKNADIFSFVCENDKAYFNLFLVRDGKLINQENFILDAPNFDPNDLSFSSEILERFLFDYYSLAHQFPNEIIIPFDLNAESIFPDFIKSKSDHSIKINIPERGRKHSLLELSNKNAISFMKQHILKWELKSKDQNKGLEELKEILKLSKIPNIIECYDISHLSGTGTVASMVLFENGSPNNSKYRKFKLKTLIDGEIDDFKSMSEVIFRRLSYLSETNLKILKKKNQVILMGGKKIIAEFIVEKSGKLVFILKYKVENTVFFMFYLRLLMEKLKVNRAYFTSNDENFFKDNDMEQIKVLPKEFLKYIPSENSLFFAFDKFKKSDSSFSQKPDLILIDGGKGQLSSAINVRNDFGINIPFISLAKKQEEVFVEGKSESLILPMDGEALNLLRRIRDEAHRFAITYQKSTRKQDFKSILDDIDGMGKTNKNILLNKYTSVSMIKSAPISELSELIGSKLAEKMLAHLSEYDV